MVDVRVGQQMNNEFQKRHVELDRSASNPNNEIKKEDKNDTTSSDSKPSESKSERIRKLKHDARKLMVRDYLLNEEIQPMQYISKIASKSSKLDPFNLLLGSLQDGLYFFSNRDPNRCAYELMHGEYTIDDTPGIDNSLQTLSMKMINGKRKFVDLLTTLKLSKTESFSLPDTETSDDMNPVDDVNVQTVLSKKERYLRIQCRFYDSDTICELFNILENEQKHQMQPESQLPELYRGLSKEYEDFLSSIFVSSHIYSTKASYILLIEPGDRTRALINGNQLTVLNNSNTDDLYASMEPPKSPGVASASSGSRPSSARSYGGRPGSAGTTSKQVSGKLVMKKREYRVTLVHRTYNHNLMLEEEKSATAATRITPLELPEVNDEQEDDAPTTDDNRHDIAQFIEISKRRKIYTTQFQLA